jgi:hypothetical protein
MSPPPRLKRPIQPILIINGLNSIASIADFTLAACFSSHSPKKTSVKWRFSGALKRPFAEVLRSSSRSETNLDRIFELKFMAINSRMVLLLPEECEFGLKLNIALRRSRRHSRAA